MAESTIFWLAFVLPLTALIGGVVVIIAALRQRSQVLEMKHRERMAMIEKGVVPAPGRDPAAFETWQQRHDSPPSRATSIGVVIVALGLALMLIIGFAGGEPGAAIGVGGSVVVLGAAFIVNGELQRRPQPRSSGPDVYSATPPRPPSYGSSDPPGGVAP